MDGGLTWKESYAGMSTAPIDSLGLGANGTVLVKTYAGMFRSDDTGKWKHDEGIPDIDSMAEDRKDQRILYAGGDKGLQRSDDGGSTWSRVGSFHDEIARIAIDGADPGTL